MSQSRDMVATDPASQHRGVSEQGLTGSEDGGEHMRGDAAEGSNAGSIYEGSDSHREDHDDADGRESNDGDGSLSSGLSIDDSEDDAPRPANAASRGASGRGYSDIESEVVRYVRGLYPPGRLPPGARQRITRALNRWRRLHASNDPAGPGPNRNSNSWRHRHAEMLNANTNAELTNTLNGTNHPLPFPRPHQMPDPVRRQTRPSSSHREGYVQTGAEERIIQVAAGEGVADETLEGRDETEEDEDSEGSTHSDILEGLRLPHDSQFGAFNFTPFITAIDARLAEVHAELRSLSAEHPNSIIEEYAWEDAE